jgi:hypothetical protein
MNIAWSPEQSKTWLRCVTILRKTILLPRGVLHIMRRIEQLLPTIPRSAERDAYLAPANWSLQGHPKSSPIGSGAPQSKSYASIMARGVGPTAFDWPAAASRKISRRSSLPVGAVAVRARPRSAASSNLAGRRPTTGRPTSPGFEWGLVGRFPQQYGRDR